MTEKQAKILEVALELFAELGFNAVSTSKIANEAGVSEGLIFRHFNNKKGLLDALYALSVSKMEIMFSPVFEEKNPKEGIRKIILLPFEVKKSEYSFWRLQFKLKWEKEYFHPEKMQPIINRMEYFFKKLKYDHPHQEAELIVNIMESISINIIRNGKKSQEFMKKFLLKKYSV